MGDGDHAQGVIPFSTHPASSSVKFRAIRGQMSSAFVSSWLRVKPCWKGRAKGAEDAKATEKVNRRFSGFPQISNHGWLGSARMGGDQAQGAFHFSTHPAASSVKLRAIRGQMSPAFDGSFAPAICEHPVHLRFHGSPALMEFLFPPSWLRGFV
jgi:hypothetical protein